MYNLNFGLVSFPLGGGGVASWYWVYDMYTPYQYTEHRCSIIINRYIYMYVSTHAIFS